MKILFIGDIVGRSGRKAVFKNLEDVKTKYGIDFCIANGENSAGGLGMTPAIYEELSCAGVDFFTMGNHTFSKSEIDTLFKNGENLVRPANYKEKVAGEGYAIIHVKNGVKLGIINLSGRVYMDGDFDNPFTVCKSLVDTIRKSTNCIFVDFHAEATSEKIALGFYLDGLVSCIAGTHTHVQTSDARVLPNGTAYITDVGMTGPLNSVLGLKTEIAVDRFVKDEKSHYQQSEEPSLFRAIIVDIDEATGHSGSIETLEL
ncbi:MAG: TIGR00282 family metallophosphoesterase [Bacillota bacterium]|nr:TIGR00282 family metallophosphoesterase [Bacillota bacterium]